jgi:hypothetical protein
MLLTVFDQGPPVFRIVFLFIMIRNKVVSGIGLAYFKPEVCFVITETNVGNSFENSLVYVVKLNSVFPVEEVRVYWVVYAYVETWIPIFKA